MTDRIDAEVSGPLAALDELDRRLARETLGVRAGMEAIKGELRARVKRASRSLPDGFRHFATSALLTDGTRYLEVVWPKADEGDVGALVVREIEVRDREVLADGVSIGGVEGTDGSPCWSPCREGSRGFTTADGFVLPVTGDLVGRHAGLARVARLAPDVAIDAEGHFERFDTLLNRLGRLNQERRAVALAQRVADVAATSDRGGTESIPMLEAA